MKLYPEIQGPNKAPQSHCIAFYKYDGSCIRAEWTKKKGWDKFGSRKVLIDDSSFVGDAVEVFLNTWANDLEKVFRDDKRFRNCRNVTVYGEFFGPRSFAGWHSPADIKEIVVFDVNIHKKGFMTPRDFLKTFGHLNIARIVYEGNFNKQFIQDVKDGKWAVKEGVVAKGLFSHGKPPHNLWMAKCKTAWWMNELKKKAEENPKLFSSTLTDNEREQNL
jgi:hypothetical protein